MIKRLTLLALLSLAGACHEPGKDSEVEVLREDTTQVKIITLQYAQAAEVAEVLKEIYKSWPRIVADQRTNSIVLRGTLEDIERARKLIQELDHEQMEE